uniref:Uncharacterized protein n=1 Tax=Aegilops tauschii subsp. strangulata TaxID=200361 RepID=A0A452XU72_AEGTS
MIISVSSQIRSLFHQVGWGLWPHDNFHLKYRRYESVKLMSYHSCFGTVRTNFEIYIAIPTDEKYYDGYIIDNQWFFYA